MTSSLQVLFAAINRVEDERDLRSQIVPQIGEYFAAKRAGIFFFDRLPWGNQSFQKTFSIALSIEHNPVVRYLVERHVPVHEGLVASPQVWTAICPRPDHWHVMAGPIVSQGKLVGVVGCTRDRSTPGFNSQHISDLSAICLHLSAWAATARSPQLFLQSETLLGNRLRQGLTPRELQIARLVALGRTNAEIGKELWITENSVKQALKRMFRKLQVSSRAEMVAQLSTSTRNYLASVP
jgi:DNA-binding CsgD family transcriptional regulator